MKGRYIKARPYLVDGNSARSQDFSAVRYQALSNKEPGIGYLGVWTIRISYTPGSLLARC